MIKRKQRLAWRDLSQLSASKLCRLARAGSLVFTIGQYNLVSWVLNSFGVPLDGFLPGARP